MRMVRAKWPAATKKWRRIRVADGKRALAFHLCEFVGGRPGPTLALVAGQHGMEPTGPAMLAMLADGLNPSRMRGRVLMVPISYANAIRCGNECEPIPGRDAELKRSGRWHQRCPYELDRDRCGRNLNRLWPGDKDGTIYEKLVAAIWKRAVAPAEFVIDFHCWQDWAAPAVIPYGKASEEMARYVGICHVQLGDPVAAAKVRKTLGAIASLAGKATLTIEYTPQTRINPEMVVRAEKGIRNLMRYLGILPGRAEPTRPLSYPSDRPVDEEHFKAGEDVIMRPHVKPEQWVRKGRILATLIPIDHPDRPSVLRAPYAGIVHNLFGHGVVARGETIMYMRRARAVGGR